MDILGANFYGAVEQIRKRLGKNSSPTVVSGPCPGRTTSESGSFESLRRESSSFDGSPLGRSVRPTLWAKIGTDARGPAFFVVEPRRGGRLWEMRQIIDDPGKGFV